MNHIATKDGTASEGTCIFCGRVEMMTGEHIFAFWTNTAVKPPYEQYSKVIYRQQGHVKEEIVDLSFKGERNRGHANMRLNVLCKECNNGWGSDLQDSVSAVLKPVLKEEAWQLTDEDREKVAKWLTSFIMVRQYLHPQAVAIDNERCRDFYRTRAPLSGVSARVARYSGENSHNSRYRNIAGGDAYFSRPNSISAPETNHSCMLTAALGNLIFFVFWSSDPNTLVHFSPNHPRPFSIANMSKEFDEETKDLPEPDNERYRSPQVYYPFHYMLAELGMSQIWPPFEIYPEASSSTLDVNDFYDLNELATHALLTNNCSLEAARAEVRRGTYSSANPAETTAES